MKSRLPTPAPRGICAVVVTFHPDAGFAERLRRIEDQVGGVIVVDNASSEEARGRLTRLRDAGRFELLEMEENLGIAAALNRGLSRASDRGFRWVITFDQDSMANENLVATLVSIHAAHPNRERLALVGANYEEEETGKTGTPKRRKRRGSYIEVDHVITSGCLQSTDVFHEIGPYREDLFMYCVDNEYCARARLAGYLVALASRPLMRHRTGHQVRHNVGFTSVTTANYAPWRYYYIVRNGLLVARRYAFVDTLPAMRHTYGIMKRALLALALESDRGEKLRYIARGIGDGLLGKSGKLREATREENGVQAAEP